MTYEYSDDTLNAMSKEDLVREFKILARELKEITEYEDDESPVEHMEIEDLRIVVQRLREQRVIDKNECREQLRKLSNDFKSANGELKKEVKELRAVIERVENSRKIDAARIEQLEQERYRDKAYLELGELVSKLDIKLRALYGLADYDPSRPEITFLNFTSMYMRGALSPEDLKIWTDNHLDEKIDTGVIQVIALIKRNRIAIAHPRIFDLSTDAIAKILRENKISVQMSNYCARLLTDSEF